MMKRFLKGGFAALCVLVAGLTLSACEKTVEYTVSTATLASGVLQLDAGLSATTETVANRASLFTPAEREIFAEARRDVENLQATLQSLIGANQGAAQALVDADTLAESFVRTRDSYRAAREVVTAHLHEFAPQEVVELRRFNGLALRVNAAVETLTHAPSGSDVGPVLLDVVRVASETARVLAIAGVL